eukprot:scaffold199856_cov51-Prasinocladus_malaysianus.AAC.1
MRTAAAAVAEGQDSPSSSLDVAKLRADTPGASKVAHLNNAGECRIRMPTKAAKSDGSHAHNLPSIVKFKPLTHDIEAFKSKPSSDV